MTALDAPRRQQFVRSHLQTARRIRRALTGKISAALIGNSPVSRSCQIPHIREKYLDLGLPSRLGTFVEIGAFDGEAFSNTSYLADQGWRGLYVEPVPDFCRRIAQRHWLNNVSVEAVAVWAEKGSTTLHLMGALSTASATSLAAYGSIKWASAGTTSATPISVSTERLESILARNDIPHSFELMIIDVEGGEEPIVASLLGSSWRPRVLVVELCDVHPDFESAPELQASHRRVRASIVGAGYSPYYSDTINSIFRL